MPADTQQVRSSNEAAAAAEHKLAESVREQATTLMQTPVEQLDRGKVEDDLRKTKPHGLTLIAFVDRIHDQLMRYSPANARHAAWLQKQFIRGR